MNGVEEDGEVEENGKEKDTDDGGKAGEEEDVDEDEGKLVERQSWRRRRRWTKIFDVLDLARGHPEEAARTTGTARGANADERTDRSGGRE